MNRLRYALSEIATNWRDTYWWRKRFLTHVPSRYFRRFERPDSEPVHALDWDVLIILDACRYDLFESVSEAFDLPGELSKRRSLETGTPGFLRENFRDGTFHDVVYVTANPYVNTLLEESQFHATVPAWRDHWSEDLQTVPPDQMAEVTRETARRYPNKRILSHFVQPHEPFIGEKRIDIPNVSAIREDALGRERPDPRERVPTAFERLARGQLDRTDVWEAYEANLEVALPHVEDLLETLDGRIAVSSDHGNAFGEFAWPFPIRVYGHPLGILIPALTDVPYHTHTNEPRPRIVPEPPEETAEEDADVATERLKQLGYAE